MKSAFVPMLLALLVAFHVNQFHADAYSLLGDIPIPPLDFLDNLLNNVFTKSIGHIPNNYNGDADELKAIALSAPDNPRLNTMNPQELIEAAGFRQETFKAFADDGYVTSLTRIVNPLIETKDLKWPPVLLLHGGTINPSCYLFASTDSHHPEKFPRGPEDGPITSYNRSLALTLANNGWDVFLAETRGSNEKNMDHIIIDTITNALNIDEAHQKNMTEAESVHSALSIFNYWDFDQDDIIQNELKSYIDKVCQIVVAEGRIDAESKCKVNLLSFSLSAPLALGFLSTRPDYAREKIHRYAMMAPTFYRDGLSSFLNLVLTRLCPLVPNQVGVALIYEMIFTHLRSLIVQPAIWKKLRYSFAKFVTVMIMGQSAKYRTLLEMNVLHHLLRAVGFKQAKQMCQQMRDNRLQKYDYGPERNMEIYNSTTPPLYDISNLDIKPWLLIVAENDKLSAPESVKRIVYEMNPKPERTIVAPEFNHLDLVAGAEVDKYVNLPILDFFDKHKAKLPSNGEKGLKEDSIEIKDIGKKPSKVKVESNYRPNPDNYNKFKVQSQYPNSQN